VRAAALTRKRFAFLICAVRTFVLRSPVALYLSGSLWSLGFAIFTAMYARILVEPRIDGRPG
jgi:uncharacterized protein involved in response to NO